MKSWTLVFSPLALAGLMACGGNTSSPTAPPSTQMDSATAEALVAPLLNEQNNQAGENDNSGPTQALEAMAFTEPLHPACVTVSNQTANSETWTFTSCTGPHGWTWNGVVLLTWTVNGDGTVLVKHNHQNLVGTKDGKTWTINGVRDNLRNPATKLVQISAEPGFTKTFNDGTATTVYTYTMGLTADWSTAGERKLFGTWALTPVNGEPINGTIAQASPLVWDKTSGCCYPVSGTMVVTKGSKTANLQYGLPCGTVTINGTAFTRAACGS
jgi:hypothetical protein